MIETAIHLLIGFLLAALLALVAVPAISRRAFRLAESQARMLAPLSAAQAKSDRDALRGQHAIEILTNERRYEAAERAAALAQIELGRRAREIIERKTEVAEKSTEIAQQRAEIAALARNLKERDVEIASREMALLDLTHQRERAADRLADAQTRIDQDQASLERRRVEVASLEARVSELSNLLNEGERASETSTRETTARLTDLTNNLVTSRAVASRLQSQVFELETRNAALRIESEGRAAEAVRLRQRLIDLEPRLSESQRVRDEFVVVNSRQTSHASEREAELIRLKTAHREEIERFQDRLSGAVARENELTMRVQALIAARVDAESAARFSASELASLGERLAKAARIATSTADGDSALRRSITRLGRDLAEKLLPYGELGTEKFYGARGRDELAAGILEDDDKAPPAMATGG